MNQRKRHTVGVVIAAMNSAEFLDQALGSLATQTRPADQIVVVDDCSDDDTEKLALRWATVLPVTVIRTPQRLGIWGGRRTGIAALTTDLVAQLDADDMVLPHHLEILSDAYAERPGLISPRPLSWTGSGPASPATYTKDRFPLPGDQLAQLLVTNYVLVGALYSRDLYHRIGGYRQIALGEDWDLWVRLVAGGAPITKVPDPSYLYRVRPGSYSTRFDRNTAQTEVLSKFLESCADPNYRRVAKLAIIQRLGTGYDGADSDPDLGRIVRTADRIEVYDRDDRRLLAMHGREIEYVYDETLRRDTSSLRDILGDGR
ncbi:glycosyltransferase family 2 protein [Fodinicola feengrottensis]|uniref:Glycosyltransferase 2-like domain-containing protein n=1 Tax=Fodinicola feengrottensis TaxID=435914 RepID=A0ABN2IKH5_9ACTN|nr:glycosyltransferase [Fodinicola feengrottensis]